MKELIATAGAGPDIEDIHSLTSAQHGILFHTLQDGRGIYRLRYLYEIEGRLDVDRLQWCFQEAVNRHPALRSAFVWQELEEPIQVVFREVALNIQLHDLTTHSSARAAAALGEFLESARSTEEDPSQAPLLEVSVFLLGAERSKLGISVHHLILDGWSLAIVMKEVFARYFASSSETQPRFPDSPSFADFVEYQRRMPVERAQQFFRDELEGFVAPTVLSQALAAPPAGSGLGAARRELTSELAAALQRSVRALATTPATLFQAAWGLVLSRYTGRESVVFGSTVSGRNGTFCGADLLVGMCINTLPMRVNVAGGSIGDWLRALHERGIQLREFEHAPLVSIRDWCGIPHGQPLFESIVVVENYPVDDVLRVERSELRVVDATIVDESNYRLALSAAVGGRTVIELRYDKASYGEAAMERLLSHFVHVLEELTGDPRRSLGAVSLGEQASALMAGRGLRTPAPDGESVLDVFFRSVDAQRANVAVREVESGEELTYGELEGLATRLARYLERLGVGPEVRVGLCVQHGCSKVWGMLGILLAGGAYVPLDPRLPSERLLWMMQDAGITLVVTESALADALPETGASLVVLDAERARIEAESAERSTPAIAAANAAYMIYTSGTSGLPKAVVAQHRGLRNLSVQGDVLGIGPGTRVLEYSSLAFDASVFEIFLALAAGATLHIGRGQWLGDELWRTLEELAIEVVTLPPSVLGTLERDGLTALRTLVIAGEACGRELAERWSRGRRLINAYGPTEGTVWSTFAECSASLLPPIIGLPIRNTDVLVLDERLEPAPCGVTGELWLAGELLTRGYANRPDLTAERFVPNPHGAVGERMYRTGDRVRWIEDVGLEFVGRRDDQVKLRGYRVELGEIEAVLRAQAGVEQAAVVCLGNETPGAGRLFGYFAVAAGSDISVLSASLTTALARQLPEHMLPTLVPLDRLPLSRNGKVDKAALPSPEQSAENGSQREPSGPTEQRLAEILRPLLGVTSLDMSKSFFAQGGHSLTAMLLLSRIRAELGAELPLRELNAAATLSDLALRVAASRGERRFIPALDAEARSLRMPLSFAQQRLWLAEQLNPGSSAYNIPAVARLRGAFDANALAEALSILARRQTALRTAIREEDGTPYQLLLGEPQLELKLDNWSSWSQAEREHRLRAVLEAEREAPFDWQSGRLLRARLMRFSEQEHVLALTVHHVVCDAWSLQILVAELIQAYERVLADGPFEPDSLALDYLDYTAWQRAALDNGDWNEALDYWRGKLASALEPLALPWKAAPLQNPTEDGALCAFEIAPALHAELVDFCREQSCTLFEALAATFAALLQRYTGQDELLLLTPAASRPVRALEGVVGFFLNNLVLKLDARGKPTFRELLARVRETVRDARAHEDVPFEQLVTSLELAKQISVAELFPVMFSWQSAEASATQPTALAVELVDVATQVAKFPLSLALKQGASSIAGSFEYRSACFDPDLVGEMAVHFVGLLQALCRSPESSVTSFEPLDGSARQRALSALEGRGVATGSDLVHDLITKAAAKSPRAVAVELGAQRLDYEGLELMSNRIAHYLRARGVGPDVVVGVWLERSLELPAVLLGILKAGGAYLPLDTELPQARVAKMLDDSSPKLILTERRLAALLPEAAAHVHCLDELRGLLFEQPTHAPRLALEGQAIAYVLYTSGSTGTPKPIAVSHGALLNHMQWLLHSFELGAADRVLQKTVAAFDASVWELFAPLMVGGTLCLAEPGGQRDPAYLVRALREHSISVLQVVPSLLEALVREPGFGALTGLRLVFCGGEALSPKLVAAYRQVQRASLCNLYGPTEACIDATAYTCRADETPASVPIGRPIWNMQARVLDAEGRLVPSGVVGELYLGGAGLARGYRGHPDWTAERFVPDGFGATGERLYRTGDLVRYRSAGVLEYVGRADGQVKLSGHRIELGDVESALERQPAVARAAVLLKEVAGRAGSLIAYVTLRPGAQTDTDDLLVELGTELPSYMLPRRIITLAELPLSVSGKVDRRALAEREEEELARAPRTSPESELEAALWRIWADVLASEDFGIDDNFIGLGGDSIKAVQVSARARTRGIELSAKSVLERQTLRRVARVAIELSAVAHEPAAAGEDFPEIDAESIRRSVERIQKKREQA